MPIPQPTGDVRGNQQRQHQQQSTVRSLTEIPVRHVPDYENQPDGRDIPVEVHDEDQSSEKQAQSPCKKPAVRKQTSLIVSDDHTTPIPLPYDRLETREAIIPEEMALDEGCESAPESAAPTTVGEGVGDSPHDKVESDNAWNVKEAAPGDDTASHAVQELAGATARVSTPKTARKIPIAVSSRPALKRYTSKVAEWHGAEGLLARRSRNV